MPDFMIFREGTDEKEKNDYKLKMGEFAKNLADGYVKGKKTLVITGSGVSAGSVPGMLKLMDKIIELTKNYEKEWNQSDIFQEIFDDYEKVHEFSKKQIVVLEEAHNYVPSTKSTVCKEIIVRLAREGRKYGISLCFVTQRPRFFDQTALSQSGNKIIFSLSNQDDIKHITEDLSVYRSELTREIQNQRVGECVVAGEAYHDILGVKINFQNMT